MGKIYGTILTEQKGNKSIIKRKICKIFGHKWHKKYDIWLNIKRKYCKICGAFTYPVFQYSNDGIEWKSVWGITCNDKLELSKWNPYKKQVDKNG